MIKAYAKGNYFFLLIPGGTDPLSDARSNVTIYPTDEVSDRFVITSDKLGHKEFDISELSDESGTPYTSDSWESFYISSSGFDSTAGGSVVRNRITVNKYNALNIFSKQLDSSKQYFIDGVVDMSGIEIEVPESGIHLKGYGFDLSCLKNTSDNETLFTPRLAVRVVFSCQE